MMTNKFLTIVIAIQLAILGLMGISALGFDIPILRQIVGFIYLTFIPGLLILRIFRLYSIWDIETFLYSVGLSITFVMIVGLFINFFYPIVGIIKPISIFPIIGTMSFIILTMCLIVYMQEKNEKKYLNQSFLFQWRDLCSPSALFLFLLPILSILGALLVYLYHENVVLLLLIFLIASTGALIALEIFIPIKLYPLAVIAISIALQWHNSLISFNIPGSDVFREYNYQNVVLNNSIWNIDIESNLSAMLSISMLGPIYSIVLNLTLVWIIKIIIPFFFSLVPLTLFQIYRKQIDDKIAFFGAFIFMSMPVFFTLTPGVRQPIAELFFALLILLLIDEKMEATKRSLLIILFSFSIVVSHYGLSYIYMLYLIMSLPLLYLLRSPTITELRLNIIMIFSKFKHRMDIVRLSKLNTKLTPISTIRVNYLILFIVICLSWYIYVSSGSPFIAITKMVDHIYSSMSDIFSTSARDPNIMQAIGMAPLRSTDFSWNIARIFQYIIQFFIVIGAINLFFNFHKTKFKIEYVAITMISLMILLLCIILPYVSIYLTIARIYHIVLIILSPICILGGIVIFRFLFRALIALRGQSHKKNHPPNSYKIVAIFVLVPYFLFTSGFIFELAGATPTSMPLSLYDADWPIYTGGEIQASKWLLIMSKDTVVYNDAISSEMIQIASIKYRKQIKFKNIYFNPYNEQLVNGSYILLRYWNTINGILIHRGTGEQSNYTSMNKINLFKSSKINKIYDNNYAQIWWFNK